MNRQRIQLRFSQLAGLTFGEMLVVLAVFATLAIMFFLSSNHVMTKTRVARVLHEQKVIRVGLANFQADHLRIPDESSGLVTITGGAYPYIPSVPQDPFCHDGSRISPYEYYTGISEKHTALIVSVGPDGDSDIGGFLYNIKLENSNLAGLPLGSGSQVFRLSKSRANKLILEQSYDPTNGSTSNGDIVTVY